MRDAFGIAVPVFIVVCLLKNDFFCWWSRKVSTYLPPLGGPCQELRAGKCTAASLLQKSRGLYRSRPGGTADLYLFTTRLSALLAFVFALIGALKASWEGRTLGTLFARYTVINMIFLKTMH